MAPDPITPILGIVLPEVLETSEVSSWFFIAFVP